MKLTRISFLLLFLPILSIYGAAQSGNQSFDARAVFKPSASVAQKIDDCSNVSCVTSVMQKARASSQAIAFTKLLDGGGYMNSFREFGKVDLAEYTHPPVGMLGISKRFLLINGSPQVIFADDPKYYDNLDLSRDPLYPSLIRKFSEIYATSLVGFKTMQQLKSGGQRFIFTSPVKPCPGSGCEIVGYAHVAFDFDSKGNFLGTKLVRLSRK